MRQRLIARALLSAPLLFLEAAAPLPLRAAGEAAAGLIRAAETGRASASAVGEAAYEMSGRDFGERSGARPLPTLFAAEAEDADKKKDDDPGPADKGAVRGAAAGGLLGAAVGFALGGPIGAAIGMLIGLIAGAAGCKGSL